MGSVSVTTWTCDICGFEETVGDSGWYRNGWGKLDGGRLETKDENDVMHVDDPMQPIKDLCATCTALMREFDLAGLAARRLVRPTPAPLARADWMAAFRVLRPYLSHQISCPWLTWMGVGRTAKQQREDCRCGFFDVVPPLLKELKGA